MITNVEPDHLDNYGEASAVYDAFATFIERIDAEGVVLLGADDAGSSRLAPLARERGLRVRTFGQSAAADVRVEGLVLAGSGSSFDLVAEGRRLGHVTLRVPGAYNAVNAAGALGLGLAVGLPFGDMARGLAKASPGSAAGSSSRASPGECGSTTTTPITRPRWPRPPSPPPAASPERAG